MIELGPKPTESGIAVAPFADGLTTQRKVRFEYIKSKQIEFGGLGKATVVLTKPKGEALRELSKNDRAFTFEADGKVVSGNLIDFLRHGYYTVEVDMDPDKIPVALQDRGIEISIWVDNTKPITTAKLDPYHDTNAAFFSRSTRNEKGIIIMEELVLPKDENLLMAMRINASSN